MNIAFPAVGRNARRSPTRCAHTMMTRYKNRNTNGGKDKFSIFAKMYAASSFGRAASLNKENMKIIDGFCLRNVMGRPTVIGESASLVDFNKLVTLNESAAYLWRAVEGRDFSLDDLTASLVSRYQIDEEIAKADAAEILEGWVKVGFIQQ